MSGDMPADNGPGRQPVGGKLRTRASLWSRLFMAGLSGLLVLGGLSCSSAQGNSTPPWKLTWTDTFNGLAGSMVRASYWQYNTGRGVFGTNEVEAMTTSTNNVRLDGHGNLEITARGHGAAGDPRATWTSGRIETRANRLFGAPPGGEMMVTASIKQPGVAHGLGYWPGFWMLGRGHWPGTGEVDIMEDVNGLSKVSGTLHCGNITQRIRTAASAPAMRAMAWAVACGRARDASSPSTPTP